VATELLKATACHDKREIDFILEDQRGRVVAIEAKASSSPGTDALRGLRWLRDTLGPTLHAGVLLHLGKESASRGDGLYTMPVSVLWNHHVLHWTQPCTQTGA
jgi:hypothetical protein